MSYGHLMVVWCLFDGCLMVMWWLSDGELMVEWWSVDGSEPKIIGTQRGRTVRGCSLDGEWTVTDAKLIRNSVDLKSQTEPTTKKTTNKHDVIPLKQKNKKKNMTCHGNDHFGGLCGTMWSPFPTHHQQLPQRHFTTRAPHEDIAGPGRARKKGSSH